MGYMYAKCFQTFAHKELALVNQNAQNLHSCQQSNGDGHPSGSTVIVYIGASHIDQWTSVKRFQCAEVVRQRSALFVLDVLEASDLKKNNHNNKPFLENK